MRDVTPGMPELPTPEESEQSPLAPQVRRAGPSAEDARLDAPQTAPGRPMARDNTEEQQQDGGAGTSPAGGTRAGQETGKRKRRTYREIDEEDSEQMLVIIDLATNDSQLDAIYASSDYARLRQRAEDLADEITAAAEEKRRSLPGAISHDPETGEIGPDPDRGNLDDRGSISDVPVDFDRGEPREEVMPNEDERLRSDARAHKTEAGAVTAAPAAAPTYKLIGLAGTLVEMLPAEEWFGELEERIEETSPGQREKWLTVNHGIIQQILRDRPEMAERLQDVVAKANQEGE